MRLYNFLEERYKKTFQERYADARKKLGELRANKQKLSKEGKDTKNIDLSINVLEQKIRLLQAQQDKKEKK